MGRSLMLKHPQAKCEECPLNGHANKFVPSEGPDPFEEGYDGIKFAFVGEAPTVADTRSGRLFGGPAGRLLDITMKHHDIDRRSECLMTNAVLCRPANNADVPDAAIAACRPRLLAELENVPTVVVLGNTAAKAVMHRTGITALRVGPYKTTSNLPHSRIIPTVHPAACLRQGDQFPHMVTDIGKAVTDPPAWEPPTWIVADDEATALDMLDQVLARTPEDGFLVLDIESNIEKDESFEVPSQHDMLCVGIGYAPNKVLVIGEEACKIESVRDKMAEVFNARKLVCQNGKFDLKGLYQICGPLELWFDTMLASYVFDERSKIHGLKYQAVEYLGAPQYDKEIEKYAPKRNGYGVIPRDILYKYNAYDVACTYALHLMYSRRFSEHSDGEALRRVHDFLVAASNQLMYVELNGIAIDSDYNNVLNAQYVKSLALIRDKMTMVIGDVSYDKAGGLNPNSPMQLKKYFASKMIDMESTDKDHIDMLIAQPTLPKDEEEVRAFLDLLLEHRTEAKAHGTYVKGIRKRMYAGRVFPTFLLHGTTTGRLSCRNPNLQNIPRDSNIRKQFVPVREENLFLQCDYAQAEARVLSFLAQDIYLRDIFNDGTIDLFDDLTPRLFGEDKTQDTMSAAEWKEMRILVKTFFYGLNYGRGAASIADDFNLSRAYANELKSNFFAVIPEVVAFQEEMKRKVHAGEDLVTPWGRRRRYALITKENEHTIMNEALAFMPQSTASDMCVLALTWTRPEIKGLGFIRNIVHDSLLVEGHRDNMDQLQEIVERNMLRAAEYIVGDYVKFKVDSKIGKNWGEV